MVEQHHQLSEHEFEQTQGQGEGQGGLACCSLWGRRVRHDLVTEQQTVGFLSPFIPTKCKLRADRIICSVHC